MQDIVMRIFFLAVAFEAIFLIGEYKKMRITLFIRAKAHNVS